MIGLLSVIDPEDDSQNFAVSDPFELVDGELRLKPNQHVLAGTQTVVDVTATDPDDPQVAITESFTLTVQANLNPVQNPRAAQIPALQYDVDNDGSVIPRDVLKVITEINRNGSRNLDESYVQPAGGLYFDGNGDNKITPLDVLDLINFVNREGFFSGGESEPEGEYGSAQRELRSSETAIAGATSAPWAASPRLSLVRPTDSMLPVSYIVAPVRIGAATGVVAPESTAPTAVVDARVVPFDDADRTASALVDADSRARFDLPDHLEGDLEEVLSDIAGDVLSGWMDA